MGKEIKIDLKIDSNGSSVLSAIRLDSDQLGTAIEACVTRSQDLTATLVRLGSLGSIIQGTSAAISNATESYNSFDKAMRADKTTTTCYWQSKAPEWPVDASASAKTKPANCRANESKAPSLLESFAECSRQKTSVKSSPNPKKTSSNTAPTVPMPSTPSTSAPKNSPTPNLSPSH